MLDGKVYWSLCRFVAQVARLVPFSTFVVLVVLAKVLHPLFSLLEFVSAGRRIAFSNDLKGSTELFPCRPGRHLSMSCLCLWSKLQLGREGQPQPQSLTLVKLEDLMEGEELNIFERFGPLN